MTTRLDPDRYIELIDSDTERLITMGERGLKAPVPCLDGWDVAEVVWHVAGVYEHKVRVMADNAWPDPWPPPEFEDKEEIGFLRDAKAHLFEEFARHDPTDQVATFGDPALDPADGTIGFWIRRMALEVAVHRYDAELAHNDTTDIPDDLAVDGIDEILRLMLAGPWWHDRVSAHSVDATVGVESGGQRWLATVGATEVSVTADRSGATAASVSGEPMAVFLWLWGRLDDSKVTFDGDADVVAQFRGRLMECTG